MATTTGRVAKILGAATAVSASFLIAGATAATAAPAHPTYPANPAHPARPGAPQFRVRQILNGMKLRHSYVPAGSSTRKSEALSSPDDITVLGHHLFTAFQNGVGPQGQASPDGNTLSTVVEFTAGGHVVRQWDIKGKCDGITADTGRQLLIATVNEDANSSVYTITPGAAAAAQVQHYRTQAAAEQGRHRRHLRVPRSGADQRLGARHDRQGGPAAELPGRVLGDLRPGQPRGDGPAAVL